MVTAFRAMAPVLVISTVGHAPVRVPIRVTAEIAPAQGNSICRNAPVMGVLELDCSLGARVSAATVLERMRQRSRWTAGAATGQVVSATTVVVACRRGGLVVVATGAVVPVGTNSRSGSMARTRYRYRRSTASRVVNSVGRGMSWYFLTDHSGVRERMASIPTDLGFWVWLQYFCIYMVIGILGAVGTALWIVFLLYLIF